MPRIVMTAPRAIGLCLLANALALLVLSPAAARLGIDRLLVAAVALPVLGMLWVFSLVQWVRLVSPIADEWGRPLPRMGAKRLLVVPLGASTLVAWLGLLLAVVLPDAWSMDGPHWLTAPNFLGLAMLAIGGTFIPMAMWFAYGVRRHLLAGVLAGSAWLGPLAVCSALSTF